AHPGRAPYIIVVDVDDSGNISSVKAIPNPYAGDEGEHGGGGAGHGGHAHGDERGTGFSQFLSSLKPDAMITYVPPESRGFQASSIGLSVYKPKRTVGESVKALLAGELEEVTRADSGEGGRTTAQ
ncbi:MAG: NifB/NifX family molybdenum-iron cluster-binding protein, partial [Conexivisphaera sp.]